MPSAFCGYCRHGVRAQGIPLVIAGSFNETYKRNAFNNGLMVLESPELLAALRMRADLRDASGAVRTGLVADLNLDTGQLGLCDESGARFGEFSLPRMSPTAQQLCACGGLEAWIAASLRDNQASTHAEADVSQQPQQPASCAMAAMQAAQAAQASITADGVGAR